MNTNHQYTVSSFILIIAILTGLPFVLNGLSRRLCRLNPFVRIVLLELPGHSNLQF